MEEIYTRIEDYLDGVLSETEQAVFEADVQADPALAAALAGVREARERLARQWAQTDDDAALNNTLHILGQQHFGSASAANGQRPTVNGQRPARWWWWAAAAALAAALLLWLAWPKTKTSEQLYAEFRHFPKANFIQKGEGPWAAVGGATLAQAESDFNQKKYADALAGFQAHMTAHPGDLESNLFKGLCELELGQTSEAIATFRVYNISAGVWVPEARWYLALCYLRNKNWGLCADLLLQIQPGEAHYEEAQGLVRQVKKQKLNE